MAVCRIPHYREVAGTMSILATQKTPWTKFPGGLYFLCYQPCLLARLSSFTSSLRESHVLRPLAREHSTQDSP